MAVPRSKRRRLVILIIILSSRLKEAFDSNSEDEVAQEGLAYCSALQPQMLMESDSGWSGAQNAAYDVVDAFVTHVETSFGGTPDYATHVGYLGEAVDEL